MYNFVYYVLYKRNLKDGKGSARYNGSLIVAVTLMIHIGLLIAIMKKIFLSNVNWKYISEITKEYKAIEIMLIVLFILSVFLYYTKTRSEKVFNYYSQNVKHKKLTDGIKVLLIIFIPLITMMIIGWKK